MRKGPILYLIMLIVLYLTIGHVFVRNITWLLSERAVTGLIESRFDYVFLYIFLFSIFVVFLFIPFKRDKWQKCNLGYVAFIIALFTEMFGFPLTIFLLSSATTLPPADFEPAVALTTNIPGLEFRMLTTSLIAGIISLFSVILIILGWKEIYSHKKDDKPVRSGIYKYIRHPQYTGILFIMTAWVFAWPTLLTLIMWPILAFVYYKLAKKEESIMIKKFGKDYEKYVKKVPMFLPVWNL